MPMTSYVDFMNIRYVLELIYILESSSGRPIRATVALEGQTVNLDGQRSLFDDVGTLSLALHIKLRLYSLARYNARLWSAIS